MALIKCPECNKEISDKSEYCLNCGYLICPKDDMDKVVRFCEDCGAKLGEDASFCSECGYKINSDEMSNDKLHDLKDIRTKPNMISKLNKDKVLAIIFVLFIVFYLFNMIGYAQISTSISNLAKEQGAEKYFVTWSDLDSYDMYIAANQFLNSLTLPSLIIYAIMAIGFYVSDVRYKNTISILATIMFLLHLLPDATHEALSLWIIYDSIHFVLYLMIILNIEKMSIKIVEISLLGIITAIALLHKNSLSYIFDEIYITQLPSYLLTIQFYYILVIVINILIIFCLKKNGLKKTKINQ